jgi:ADP-ribose pyrophosphatase YjhB (NUDIX family)
MNKLVTSCGCCVVKYIDDIPHVLLVKPFEKLNLWGIPKGHLNENESYVDCAIRETFEETGVKVVIIEQLLSVKTSYRKETKTVVSFLAKLEDQDAVPFVADNENVAVAFMPISDLSKFHVYQRPLIKQLASRIAELPQSLFI